jgi:hypothetical protein
MLLIVLLPRLDADLRSVGVDLIRGSGIVSWQRLLRDETASVSIQPPAGPGRGNGYADRLRAAALRRSLTDVPAACFQVVGYWDDWTGVMRLEPRFTHELSRWLGHPVTRNDLEARDSRENVRQQARQDMRRAMMTGHPDQAQRLRRMHPGLPPW